MLVFYDSFLKVTALAPNFLELMHLEVFVLN